MTRWLSPVAGVEVRHIEATLDVIEPLLKSPDLSKYVRERLSTVCMDLLGMIGSRANTARLESAARGAVDFDLEGLRQLLDRLIALPSEALDPQLLDDAAGGRQRLEVAKKLIETTEGQIAEIDPMEI